MPPLELDSQASDVDAPSGVDVGSSELDVVVVPLDGDGPGGALDDGVMDSEELGECVDGVTGLEGFAGAGLVSDVLASTFEV